jgi:hypothetical protein
MKEEEKEKKKKMEKTNLQDVLTESHAFKRRGCFLLLLSLDLYPSIDGNNRSSGLSLSSSYKMKKASETRIRHSQTSPIKAICSMKPPQAREQAEKKKRKRKRKKPAVSATEMTARCFFFSSTASVLGPSSARLVRFMLSAIQTLNTKYENKGFCVAFCDRRLESTCSSSSHE